MTPSFGLVLLPLVLLAGGAETSPKAPPKAAKAPAKPDPNSEKVDRLVRGMMQALSIPGLSLAVVRNGKTIQVGAYGLSNVEHDVPARPETVYLLASITKSFTAMAVLMLVEEGKIVLDEAISKHLPDAPAAWKGITVRHLLTHTSGLRDRFESPSAEEWRLNYSTEQMYRAARETPTDFSPGERWQYSDQGYFLLGMIIEKVSGKSYREFLTERLFRPLGMTATTTVRQDEIVKHMASGYTRAGDTLAHNHRRTDYGLVSHFGILSSAVDLARWAAALQGGKLLKKETLAAMWTPTVLKDGTPFHGPLGAYGFGWFLAERNGHRIVQHGGSTGTAFWHLPDDRLTVVVLTNLEALAGGDAPGIAKRIAALSVPDATWAAMKPKPDPDPALTKKLKAEIVRLGDGKPDLTLYTPEYGQSLRSVIEQQAEFYNAIGPLQQFDYLGRREHGTSRLLFYRAAYRQLALHYTVALDPDGRITLVTGEP
jgi:CubicO group peptidase (beta-lactamase class C family)